MGKGERISNYLVALGPLVLGSTIVWGMSLAIKAPSLLFWGIVALFIFGFTLFFTAKLSVIRSGLLVSFGARNMNRRNKAMYFTGCALMGLALVIPY